MATLADPCSGLTRSRPLTQRELSRTLRLASIPQDEQDHLTRGGAQPRRARKGPQ